MRSYTGRKLGWADVWAWVGIIALVYACSGCTDAENAARAARGKDHRIRLYSGGQVVGEWTSQGHTRSPEGSSILVFKDKESGLYVKLRGTIAIEQIKE